MVDPASENSENTFMYKIYCLGDSIRFYLNA